MTIPRRVWDVFFVGGTETAGRPYHIKPAWADQVPNRKGHFGRLQRSAMTGRRGPTQANATQVRFIGDVPRIGVKTAEFTTKAPRAPRKTMEELFTTTTQRHDEGIHQIKRKYFRRVVVVILFVDSLLLVLLVPAM
jgi:hypothetical protein